MNISRQETNFLTAFSNNSTLEYIDYDQLVLCEKEYEEINTSNTGSEEGYCMWEKGYFIPKGNSSLAVGRKLVEEPFNHIGEDLLINEPGKQIIAKGKVYTAFITPQSPGLITPGTLFEVEIEETPGIILTHSGSIGNLVSGEAWEYTIVRSIMNSICNNPNICIDNYTNPLLADYDFQRIGGSIGINRKIGEVLLEDVFFSLPSTSIDQSQSVLKKQIKK